MSRRLLAINALLGIISLMSAGFIVKHLVTSHTVSAARTRPPAPGGPPPPGGAGSRAGPRARRPAAGPGPAPGGGGPGRPPARLRPAAPAAGPGRAAPPHPALPDLPFGKPLAEPRPPL